MNAEELTTTQLIDGIPTLKLLEGLARLYQLVLVVDSHGRVTWMSNELGVLCGDAEFHIGRDVRTLFPKLPKPEQAFAIRFQLRERGFLSNMRVDLDGKQGATIPTEVSILPVCTSESDTPLCVVIARPLEERERREGRYPGANGLLPAILDSAPDAVLALDERGFVTYANAAVERLLGQAPEQLLDHPVALLLSNALDLERLVSHLVPGREICDQDLELHRGDGSTVRVSASASALRASPGGPNGGTVLFLRDVTARREAEAEISRRSDELEHCVQALAHDLRSPLVALLGFSRLLHQDFGPRLDETGSHFLDRIEQAGRTMETLIHDVLELSRIGQPGEQKSLVDPRAVLLQLKAELKPRLEAASICLTFPEDPPMVYCDRTRLYQVLSNLIGNAIDHMGPCDDPHITVNVEERPDEHCVSVRDAGRGIAPEHHQHVFEAFRSLGPSSDGRNGTGIGLAIVKKIAETHSGQVWVESKAGEGATFHVTFPRS
jgi:PAS domain S-box-containing protein